MELKNLSTEFVAIEEIEEIEEISDVYDITVEENHNFFANGMLVHNCIGGFPSWSIFRELQNLDFDKLDASLLDSPKRNKLLNAMGNCYEAMMRFVKPEDFYLELQFNRLPAQNLVNRVLIEFACQEGLTDQLIVTCDAHYARPELWKDRELYKKLGYLNYKDYSADSLPKSKDELKCQLYPKNAQQIWDEYLISAEGNSWYDDDLIKDAIERTHDIAHQIIGEVKPDRTPKFPNERLTPKDLKPIQHLINLCKAGLIKRGKADDQRYIDRLKDELTVIKKMKNADYFISYQTIMELSRGVCLVGPARGSGGGSLVNYVLFITDLDPIKWDLPFARFLSVYRKGAPDIDCVNENHLVIMSDKSYKKAKDIIEGDLVLGGDGKPHKVTKTYSRQVRFDNSGIPEVPVLFQVQAFDGTLGDISVVPNHKMILSDGTVVPARHLIGLEDVELMASCPVKVLSCESDPARLHDKFVDLTVEDDHRFFIVPFDVVEDS